MKRLDWYGDGKGDVKMAELIESRTPVRIVLDETGDTIEGIPVDQTGEELDLDFTLDCDGNRGDLGKGSISRWNIRSIEILR